ncbi:hypothetical protein BDY21DRAFT_421405 [Lineolata rhizophorae]|uniref:HAM1-like N-terminal domain-containing protein n=1 Tax=Lineolata rhizophorae TaxID=578093 RepID=A0A6A6P112_9PEZI|nr:hypothetical protein BDY21DRAFT_421405 [Lineolata rhizophorae]
MLSSCFGLRKSRRGDDEEQGASGRGGSGADREPLLARYDDETALQRELHKKLHTYAMLRALAAGRMPSTEQAIANIRTLLAADALNPEDPGLSDSGRLLAKYARDWLGQLAALLRNKNGRDQLQDFAWCLAKARVSVDADDVARNAGRARARADTVAAYRSLQSVGSLLLTNSDFRLFLADLNVVGREVFKDTAFALSSAADDAGRKLEPSDEQQDLLREPGADAEIAPRGEGQQDPQQPHRQPAPSGEDLERDAAEVGGTIVNGAAQVAREAARSATDKAKGDEKDTLLHRLKQAVLKLRQRPDYSESVSTLSMLLKRYALTYSRVLSDVADTAQADVHANPAAARAVRNFWELLTSFGDKKEWEELERRWSRVLRHKDNDPEFEDLLTRIGDELQALLIDPDFFDHAQDKFDELREKARQVGSKSGSSLRADADAFLEQLQRAVSSIARDADISALLQTSLQISRILSPASSTYNRELVDDALRVFIPRLISAIQHIPIPRLELSTPSLDLLLENLILEPGSPRVPHTSFFPSAVRVESVSAVQLYRAAHDPLRDRTRREARPAVAESRVAIALDGLSLHAADVGFVLRARPRAWWLPRQVTAQGLASAALDGPGVDVRVELDVAARAETSPAHVVSLRAVKVRAPGFDVAVAGTGSWWRDAVARAARPLLRPLLRRRLEAAVAAGVAAGLRWLDTELVFARERLRATRVAEPRDLATFVRAVAARAAPAESEDVYGNPKKYMVCTCVGMYMVFLPGLGRTGFVMDGFWTPACLLRGTA